MISNTINLPRNDFKEVFIAMDWERYQPVNLLSETIVRMRKTDNPYFEQVTKLQSNNLFIGMEYEKRVITEIEKANMIAHFNFKVQETWFRHITKSLVHHKDDESKLYVMMEQHPNMKPISTEYFFKGESIEKRMFEAFLISKSESSKQPQERKVMPLVYSFDSIKEMTINKTRYILH